MTERFQPRYTTDKHRGMWSETREQEFSPMVEANPMNISWNKFLWLFPAQVFGGKREFHLQLCDGKQAAHFILRFQYKLWTSNMYKLRHY